MMFIVQSARYLAECVRQAGLRDKDEAESAAGKPTVQELAGRQKVMLVALTEMRCSTRQGFLCFLDRTEARGRHTATQPQADRNQEVNRQYSWSGTEGC